MLSCLNVLKLLNTGIRACRCVCVCVYVCEVGMN